MRHTQFGVVEESGGVLTRKMCVALWLCLRIRRKTHIRTCDSTRLHSPTQTRPLWINILVAYFLVFLDYFLTHTDAHVQPVGQLVFEQVEKKKPLKENRTQK